MKVSSGKRADLRRRAEAPRPPGASFAAVPAAGRQSPVRRPRGSPSRRDRGGGCKVLEEFDQLPVAAADRAARGSALISIVRIVPEDRLAGKFRPAPEQRDERNAVHVLFRSRRHSGQLQQRRIEIRRGDRNPAAGTGRGHAGTADQQGFPGSPLVHPPLPFGERRVAGGGAFRGGESAVVGGEDHNRVIRDAGFVEAGEQPADVLVDALDHRGIGGVGLKNPPPHPFVPLLPDREILAVDKRIDPVQSHRPGLPAELLYFLRPGLDRRMHAVVPEIEEERPVGIAGVDPADRLIGQPVRQILPRRTVFEGRNLPRTEITHRRMPVVTAADIHVKTVTFRPVRFVAEVPLAEMPGLITALAQGAGQRTLRKRQLLHIGSVDQVAVQRMRGTAVVDPVGHANPGGIFSAHDAGTGRRTDRTGGVGVGEQHPLRRQPVEVRGLVEGAAHAADIPPAHVVHQDQYDVRMSLHSENLLSAYKITPTGAPGNSRIGRSVSICADRVAFTGFPVIFRKETFFHFFFMLLSQTGFSDVT